MCYLILYHIISYHTISSHVVSPAGAARRHAWYYSMLNQETYLKIKEKETVIAIAKETVGEIGEGRPAGAAPAL